MEDFERIKLAIIYLSLCLLLCPWNDRISFCFVDACCVRFFSCTIPHQNTSKFVAKI